MTRPRFRGPHWFAPNRRHVRSFRRRTTSLYSRSAPASIQSTVTRVNSYTAAFSITNERKRNLDRARHPRSIRASTPLPHPFTRRPVTHSRRASPSSYHRHRNINSDFTQKSASGRALTHLRLGRHDLVHDVLDHLVRGGRAGGHADGDLTGGEPVLGLH